MENTIIDDDATIVADAPASSKAPATAVSRKEILPAFCITVVAAIALYALMSYVQPLLMNNNFIYDFGTMSYADAKVGPQIEKRARAKLGGEGDKPDPVRLALARAQAARRIVGTELAVACAERESDHVLVLSTKKGCWLRTVPAADNPGLWLLDMVRRAAAGLPQAEGTGFLPAGQVKQSDPPGRSQSKDPTPKKKHPLRVLLAVLGILALAAFGVAWYLTDGDLAALPQRLKTLHLPEWVTLWQAHEPKPGARLV